MAGTAHTESITTGDAAALAVRWTALHKAGQEIGALASLAPEPFNDTLSTFPERIQARGGARLTLVRDGIADLDAILKPGLTALRTIHARGQDTTAPALALWREFHALRSALLDIAREPEAEEREPVA